MRVVRVLPGRLQTLVPSLSPLLCPSGPSLLGVGSSGVEESSEPSWQETSDCWADRAAWGP